MLLNPMLTRLAIARRPEDILQVGLRDVIALHGAERGNIQLVGSDGQLVQVAAHALGHEFLRAFERLSPDAGTVCCRAVRAGRPVFVADVRLDPDFAPYRQLAASVPFRAVLCCPLIASDGCFVGAMSAHSTNSFRPTTLEMQTVETYGRHLADAIAAALPHALRPAVAEKLCRQLLAASAERAR